MEKSYYNPEDLKKLLIPTASGAQVPLGEVAKINYTRDVTEFQKEMGDKFFEYYGAVFEEGALTKREKSLIALAVAHVIQCPYCIDAYTDDTLQQGCSEEQMMEAVHVATAIRGGSSLVHGVQMMNQVKKLSM